MVPAFYLNPDPDPAQDTNADADPCQTLKSQKVEFLHEKSNLTNLYPLHVVFIRLSFGTAGIHSCLVGEDQLCIVYRLEIQAVMMQLSRVEHSKKIHY